MEQSKKIIIQIFRDYFDDEELLIEDNFSPKNYAQWDSYAHLELIEIIQSELNVKFELDEIVNMKCFNDIVQCVERKKNGRN